MRLTERSTVTASRFLARREAVQRSRERHAARLRVWSAALNDLRKERRRLLADAAQRLRAQRLTRSNSAATNAP